MRMCFFVLEFMAWLTFLSLSLSLSLFRMPTMRKVRDVEVSLQLLTRKAYELASSKELQLGPTDRHFSSVPYSVPLCASVTIFV